EDTAADENRTDFQIDFARDLLAQAKSNKRQDLVTTSKAFFDKVRAEEEKKVSLALEKLGVVWSAGPASSSGGQLQGSLSQGEGAAAGQGEEHRAGDGAEDRGHPAQRLWTGGDPDQRRPVRRQGAGAGGNQAVLLRLRGGPRVQG